MSRVDPLGAASCRHREAAEFVSLFESCDRLEAAVVGLYSQPFAVTSDDPRAWAINTAPRTLKTFGAVLMLADVGYGEQALMLARTIFEDSMVAWWASLQPTTATNEMITSHDQSVLLKLHSLQVGWDQLETLNGITPWDDAEQRRFATKHKVDRGRASKKWADLGIPQMADAVRPHLSDADQRILRFLLEAAYPVTNLVVHHTTLSVTAGMNRSERGGIIEDRVSRLPSRTMVRDPLTIAYHSLSLLARLLVPAQGQAELDQMLTRDRWHFHLHRPPAESVGRNDPCVCGSGLKRKQCHLEDAHG